MKGAERRQARAAGELGGPRGAAPSTPRPRLPREVGTPPWGPDQTEAPTGHSAGSRGDVPLQRRRARRGCVHPGRRGHASEGGAPAARGPALTVPGPRPARPPPTGAPLPGRSNEVGSASGVREAPAVSSAEAAAPPPAEPRAARGHLEARRPGPVTARVGTAALGSGREGQGRAWPLVLYVALGFGNHKG